MAKLKEETRRVSDAAWVTLGMPFDSPMIEEKIDGIVDVEALIIATLLVMENDRLVTDLPAWINRFSGLVSFQKLKTLFKGLSISHGKTVLANLGHDYFAQTPKGFRNAFGLQAKGRGAIGETIHRRTQKINSIENVGRFSVMIRNRLIYGTGFRADLITLLHIGNIDLKGTELAKLMCADNSTVSRILNDLKTSGFLNPHRRNESYWRPLSRNVSICDERAESV